MIHIVTDTACDLPDDLIERHRISLVPLTIRFGSEEYVDRRDLSVAAFWRKLATADTLPETAAPSVGAFLDCFTGLAKNGATGIVALCMSSSISATYQSAVLAAERLANEIPIRVIDSRVVSAALGLQALEAASVAEAGEDLEAVATAGLEAAASTNVFAALDTLEFLKRGGRIGGAQALLGSLLDIKPLIAFADGAVAPAGRVRTRSKAKSAIVDRARELAPNLKRLAVLHGAAPDVAELADEVAGVSGIDPIITELGPVVGTHTGPGAIGIAYQLG